MPRRQLVRAGAGLLVALAGACWVFRVWLFHDNLHVVLPGQVYRSAQLDVESLDALIDELSLRTLVNLRGGHDGSEWFRRQRRLLADRRLASFEMRLSALRLPSRQDLERLIEILQTAERPVLIHCLRGTDRSGLAAALAVLLAGADLDRARREYTLSHGFVSGVSLSDLPDLLAYYEAWLAEHGLASTPGSLVRFSREGYTPYFYRASIDPVSVPGAPSAERDYPLAFDVTNASPRPWRFVPTDQRGVHLGLQLAALDPGSSFQLELRGETPHHTLEPGESIRLAARLPRLPRAGRYRLTVDLVDEEVTWFSEMGSPPLELELAVSTPRDGS